MKNKIKKLKITRYRSDKKSEAVKEREFGKLN